MYKAKQNVLEAVRLLGISRAALDYRLKKYAMRYTFRNKKALFFNKAGAF